MYAEQALSEIGAPKLLEYARGKGGEVNKYFFHVLKKM
jgi:hypothetical protein